MLCALGLLVYTETLGRVRRWNFGPRYEFYGSDGHERPKANFEAAFDRFDGGSYGEWRRRWEDSRMNETSIYEVLRSGMVHEYRPKVLSAIHMGNGRGVDQQGERLFFYILPYFDHFKVEASDLLAALAADPGASLPAPDLRIANAPVNLGGSVSGSTARGMGAVASGADLSGLTPKKKRPE